MAERDVTRKELLFSDVPGDAEKVRAVLAGWGVEEASIRRLLREHRPDPPLQAAPDAERGATPRRRASH
jgi:hypothetical protein